MLSPSSSKWTLPNNHTWIPLHINMHKRFRHKNAALEHTKPVTSDTHSGAQQPQTGLYTATTTTVATHNPNKMCTVVTTTKGHSHSGPIPQQVTRVYQVQCSTNKHT